MPLALEALELLLPELEELEDELLLDLEADLDRDLAGIVASVRRVLGIYLMMINKLCQ